MVLFEVADFLNLNRLSIALSCCCKKDDEWYGVSAGHIAEIEEPMIAYIHQGSKEARRIGMVVPKSRNTASLVFRMDTNYYGIVEIKGEMILSENSGLRDEPFSLAPTETSKLELGTTLVGFGAQGRFLARR